MPSRIISTQGTAFTSKDFGKFCRDNNIKHILTAFRRPRANGYVQRANRIIMSMLLPTVDKDNRWDDMLRSIQRSIDTMQKKTTT